MIIGITGTLGAGKGAVVDYLVEKKGFRHYSVREFLKRIIQERGMPNNRDSMLSVANELRAKYGPGYIAECLLSEAQASRGDAVIESVRTVGETEYLKSHGAKTWAVDAKREIRYTRIVGR